MRLATFALGLSLLLLGHGAPLGATPIARPAAAANCAQTSTALTPLSDLGANQYQGFAGGLYPNGQNTPPSPYLQQGLSRAAAVTPRLPSGLADPNGKIVMLSIGMSNTTQEYARFKAIADVDPAKNPKLVVVDGAQGGQDAVIISNPNANFWNVVDQRLSASSVTTQQVQVAWLKEAIAGENRVFPNDAQGLQANLQTIVGIMQARYPNLQLIYLASRTYAGYASTSLNPEPYAYQSGFAVKWLIEARITGATTSPWLGWGPYLWTNGLAGRGDGLVWLCQDTQPSDGTHPSETGRNKVANLLLQLFKTDPTATPWFVGAGASIGLGYPRFINPVRVVDTRAGYGPIGYDQNGQAISVGQLADQAVTHYRVAGQTFSGVTVPTDTTGVLINVTLSQPSAGGGYVTVYPSSVATAPLAATVNPSTPIASNFWTVGLAPFGGASAGAFAVKNVGGARDLIVDLVGYYSPTNPATVGPLTLIQPTRVLDTRAAFGPIGYQPGPNCAPIVPGQLAPNTLVRYQLGGCAFGATVFPTDTTGILAHVTTVQNSASGGFTTLLPGNGMVTPTTATLTPSTPIAFNSWAVGIPASGTTPTGLGQLALYATNPQDVIIDVVGYYSQGLTNTLGALALVTPTRVVDTRIGVGPIGFNENGQPIQPGPLAAGAIARYRLNGMTFASGSLLVPSDAKGALMNVTLSQPNASGGFLTIYPGDQPAAPIAATVNPSTPIAQSFWWSGLPAAGPFGGTLAAFNAGAPRDLIVDLVGYYR